ncbi:VOC family protein [Streptomyces apocyni]|uniref:VOC family protein n=1 Tax=Streptomyces apocyni TaxID=2654677 RepID=UPI0012E9E9D4|nr:VOC family protein [Streptomyces apocyni]
MTTHTTPRFDLIGIVVSDLAASLAFYRRLGLVFPEAAEDQPHVEAELPGGLRFALDTEETVRSFHPDWRPPTSEGRIGLAFLCGDAPSVDARYAELTAAGGKGVLAPFDAFWGQRYATVEDPDGNGVDLFAPLEATRSPEATGGR